DQISESGKSSSNVELGSMKPAVTVELHVRGPHAPHDADPREQRLDHRRDEIGAVHITVEDGWVHGPHDLQKSTAKTERVPPPSLVQREHGNTSPLQRLAQGPTGIERGYCHRDSSLGESTHQPDELALSTAILEAPNQDEDAHLSPPVSRPISARR